jgi:hypothetical protein
MSDVRSDVESFESSISGDDDWNKDEDKVKKRDKLIDDINGIAAEHMDAEQTCANAINALVGGPHYVTVSADGSPPPAGSEYYAMSKKVLDGAYAEGELPWASHVEWDKPWYRDAIDGVANFGKGVWEGLKGTVTGLFGMINPFDWDTFSSTWKGIGTIAVDVATVTVPVVGAIRGKDAIKKSGQRLGQVGKAMLNVDEWKKNPAKAAGMLTADVLTTVATGGGGAGAKVLSTAGKAGKAASMLGKGGKFVAKAGDLSKAFAGNFKFDPAKMGNLKVGNIKVGDLGNGLKVRAGNVHAAVKDLPDRFKYAAGNKAMDVMEKAIPKYHAARASAAKFTNYIADHTTRPLRGAGNYVKDSFSVRESHALRTAGGPDLGHGVPGLHHETPTKSLSDYISEARADGHSGSRGAEGVIDPGSHPTHDHTIEVKPPKSLAQEINRSKYPDTPKGEARYQAAVEDRRIALKQFEAKVDHLANQTDLHWKEPDDRYWNRNRVLGDDVARSSVERPDELVQRGDFDGFDDMSKSEAKKAVQGLDFDHKTELQLGGKDHPGKNGQWLDRRVNRSVGSQIRWDLIKKKWSDSSFTKGLKDSDVRGSSVKVEMHHDYHRV